MIKVSIENPHKEDIQVLRDVIDFLTRITDLRSESEEEQEETHNITVDELPLKINADQMQEVDSAGVPFDSKIHARTRAKNVDGTWRRKRGLDAVDQVPAAGISTPSKETLPATVAPGKYVDQTGNGNHAVVAAPVVTVEPVVTIEPAKRFENLVSRITNLRLDGKLTQVQVTQINKKYGLTGFHEIMPNRPDIIDKYAADVEAVANLG